MYCFDLYLSPCVPSETCFRSRLYKYHRAAAVHSLSLNQILYRNEKGKQMNISTTKFFALCAVAAAAFVPAVEARKSGGKGDGGRHNNLGPKGGK